MTTKALSQGRTQILNELERYYQEKLERVRAKRARPRREAGEREVLAGGDGVKIRINAKEKEVTLSWIEK